MCDVRRGSGRYVGKYVSMSERGWLGGARAWRLEGAAMGTGDWGDHNRHRVYHLIP